MVTYFSETFLNIFTKIKNRDFLRLFFPKWVVRNGRTGTMQFVLIQRYVIAPQSAPVIVPEQDGFQILKM